MLLDLADSDAVERGFATVMASARAYRPDAELRGVLIAPMRRGGVETIIGAQRDPVFGPMVMFGLGGVMVELFKDVAFASAPVSLAGAHRLIRSVRGQALLEGWRGAPGVDMDGLAAAVCRVSELAAAHAGHLQGIEVNPFLAGPGGGVALDALITKEPPKP